MSRKCVSIFRDDSKAFESLDTENKRPSYLIDIEISSNLWKWRSGNSLRTSIKTPILVLVIQIVFALSQENSGCIEYSIYLCVLVIRTCLQFISLKKLHLKKLRSFCQQSYIEHYSIRKKIKNIIRLHVFVFIIKDVKNMLTFLWYLYLAFIIPKPVHYCV